MAEDIHSWLKLNAEPIPPAPGGDPHNGTKNVYVNKTRDVIAPNGTQQFPYPDGSIVIKEATRPGKDYIGTHRDYAKKSRRGPQNITIGEFTEYLRDAPDAAFSLKFQGAICWGCHARVEDIDYVFTELE